MVRDGVAHDLEQLLGRVDGADGEAVQQLHHEAGEAFESAWDAHRGRDLDEYAFGGGNEDLELAGFVEGRVEEGKKALRLLKSRR